MGISAQQPLVTLPVALAWLAPVLVVLLLCAPFWACGDQRLTLSQREGAAQALLSSGTMPALPAAPVCLAHCPTHNLLLGTPMVLAVLALVRICGAPIDVSLRSRLGLPPLLPPPQFA
jgi:hypothetical protein